MRHAVLPALVAACGAACAGPTATRPLQPPAEPAPAAGAAPPPEPAARQPGLPEPVARRIAASVEALDSPWDARAPERIASALRGLAAAVEVLPGATWERGQKIRDAAGALAGEDDDAGRIQAVQDGLDAVARALIALEPPARPAEFQEAVASVGEAIDSLDREAPLRAQQPAVSRALRTAADAVFLASGRERRFTGRQVALPAGSRDAFAERVAAATSAVEKLATSSSGSSRRAAGDALTALAAAVDAAPARPDAAGRLVADVRFEAERLRRSDPLSFGETRWIRVGLMAALDALDALPAGRAQAVRPWLAAARRATEAIAPNRLLSFQRAAVQDAFRSAVDAFSAAAGRCQCRPPEVGP